MKSNPVAEEREGLQSILEQARAGNREAFDRLIRLFEKQIMKTAFYLTRNLEDARDVAQEVYMKIFRHLGTAQSQEKINGWIYRITVNTARDFHRKQRLRAPLKRVLSVIMPPDPVCQSEMHSRLTECLAKLSFNQRAAFIFKELQEMETSEVAAALGCSEVTVRGYLHDARKKLQKYFQDFREES
ncbi:MAG TPA: RNA polymerase sigma factor [Acidobacteriota bacterium]|jgi:RNA polymerase sigma-70 factor (ECF subfamily)|nr:RNA polymerase sigma factor [Acidobacteriota bacterium]